MCLKMCVCFTPQCLHHTARHMWCSSIETRYMPVLIISRRTSPCVHLLSLATVLRAKIHINVALWVEKSIMLLPLPLTYILVFLVSNSEFIKTQLLTCCVSLYLHFSSSLSSLIYCPFISLNFTK